MPAKVRYRIEQSFVEEYSGGELDHWTKEEVYCDSLLDAVDASRSDDRIFLEIFLNSEWMPLLSFDKEAGENITEESEL